ncbi:hypothetical protein [Desulfonatronovibrio magnus]|uniref:hypothetical protein n=1 Tax=Desulfonatronovibrio magnus TaxID=698827 RepID=UPI0005EBB010|nr:hypothetical protein [Desulfonatronovibrio magnus]
MSEEQLQRLRGTAWKQLQATMDTMRLEAKAKGLTEEVLNDSSLMKAKRFVVDSLLLRHWLSISSTPRDEPAYGKNYVLALDAPCFMCHPSCPEKYLDNLKS